MRIPITPANTRLLAQRQYSEPPATSRRRKVLAGLYDLAMLRVGILPTPGRDVRTRLIRRESGA